MSKKIAPIAIEATAVVPIFGEIQIPDGKVAVIPLKEGKEQPELAFFVSESTANKSFAPLTERFVVKKKNPLN